METIIKNTFQMTIQRLIKKNNKEHIYNKETPLGKYNGAHSSNGCNFSNEKYIYEDKINKNIFDLFKNKINIDEIINESKYILELEDNWDDEGAKGFGKNIWDESINIIKSIPNNLINNLVKPDILPTINGNINISWRHNDYSILIEINSDLNIYYNIYVNGKNYGGDYDNEMFIHTILTKIENVGKNMR